ncbi:hypothetical protein MMC22_011922 [Lobaria immixta]|nr:hypothetical protein [Lobaria immixta]
MTTTSLSVELGAAGRPTLSYLTEKAIRQLRAEGRYVSISTAAPARLARQIHTPASERDALKLDMLRRIRSPPLKYAWAFFHSKRSTSANEGQLTAMVENIITIKPFWEIFNQFPLGAMKMKDSVHLFKRGVKPVWEDPRNITGGSWTFRVPKAQTKEFWKETLLLVVGEQFADVIQPRDDLCGVSLSVRFNSNLIMIWNRDGTNQKSIDGILSVMLDKISPDLKPKDGSWYYKKHSTHAGFDEVVAKAREARLAQESDEAEAVDGGENKIKENQGDKTLL